MSKQDSDSDDSTISSSYNADIKLENIYEPVVVVVDGEPFVSETDLLEETNPPPAQPKQKAKRRRPPLTMRTDEKRAKEKKAKRKQRDQLTLERQRQKQAERRLDESVRERERERDRERKRRKRELERQDEEKYKELSLERARQRQAKRRLDESFRERERARDRERKRLKRAMEKESVESKVKTENDIENEQNFSNTIFGSSPPFKCSQCSLSFQIRSTFLIHELSHFHQINCPVCCEKVFDDQLMAHMQRQHPTKSSVFICDFCGQSFSQKIQILDHICAAHLLTVKLDCLLCNFSTYSDNLMNLHLKSHDFDEVICDLCGMNFQHRKDFNAHLVKVHNSGIGLQCELCGKQFKARSHLFKHQKSSHRIEPEVLPNSSSPLIHCELCGKNFYSQSGLTLHRKRKHEGKQEEAVPIHKPYVCTICSKAYTTSATLNAHISRWHIDKSGVMNCEECDFETDNYNKLKHHRYTHHNKKIMCNICGRGFSCPSHLNKHIQGVHGEKKYECNLCGLKVSHPAYLKRHMNERHISSKRYHCNFCENIFVTKNRFALHIEKAHNITDFLITDDMYREVASTTAARNRNPAKRSHSPVFEVGGFY